MANHSKKYNLVRTYYKGGFWKKRQVENAVKKGWITSDEYEEITGEAYPKKQEETAVEAAPTVTAGDAVPEESVTEDAEEPKTAETVSEESASDSEE